MKSTGLRRMIVLAMLCLLCAGCQWLNRRSSNDDNPIKPLHAENTQTTGLFFSKRKPSERELCVETAKTVAEKGYANEAMKLYEKAERLEPKSAAFDNELAPLYAQVGETQKSIERYRRIIEAGKADADLHNNLAWTLTDAGRYDEAIDVIRAARKTDPNNERLEATYAITLYKSGQRDEAFAAFLGLYGESAAHHNLAVLDLDSGDVDSAARHAQIAASLPERSDNSVVLRDAIVDQLAKAAADPIVR